MRRLHDFANSFLAFSANPRQAAVELLRAIERASKTAAGPEQLAELAGLIVGQLKKGKATAPARVEYSVQLLFDFWSDDDPSFSLYSHAMRESVLNAVLAEDAPPAMSETATLQAEQGLCALMGRPARLLRAPFPGWAAKPVISKSLRPFDKFSAAPCNFRYRRADSEGFDIGEATANEIVGALTTVTAEPMRGKTWRPLKNGMTDGSGSGREQSDVLIAFPSCSITELQTEQMPAIVNVLGEPDADKEEEHAGHRKRFEEAAEPVCAAFEKAIALEVDSKFPPDLQILLIRQVSSGQIQIAYSAQPSLSEFVQAVKAWSLSAANLPAGLRVPLRSVQAGFMFVKPRLVFPERINRVLARQWIRAGLDSGAVPAPPVSMVLDVFLRRPGALPTLAAELLNLALSRSEALLIGLGGAIHADRVDRWFKGAAKGKGKPDVGYAAAHTLSLIGSLLYTMNSNVSQYSRSTAFLVGNLLAMMDELHKHYCVVVRDGDVPPSLIGNSLLGRASDSPAQALAELCDRSRPYIGWAKTVASPGKNAPESIRIAVNSARKLLRVAQPLCDQLGSDQSLSRALGDLDKAHLLLGYLSPTLRRDKDTEATTDNGAVDDNMTEEVHTP